MKIRGEFDVKLMPMDTYAKGTDGIKLARMSIDKTFRGDLSAKSQGEMLSAMTSTKGSAGYAAIELVVGSLMGKDGSFVLQHFGTMDKGKSRLILEVVPDSGGGELVGIAGKMQIEITGGKHFYEFEFEIGERK